MTYGWAILASILAIGALIYFGGTQPETDSKSILLSPPFLLEAYSCDENSGICSFEVYNSGLAVIVKEINIKYNSVKICGSDFNPEKSILSGGKDVLAVNCPQIISTAGKFVLAILYTNSGSQIVQESIAELTAVQEIEIPNIPNPIQQICGNNLLEGVEECDDGDTEGGDGCSAYCQDELICGNSLIEGVEECDDGNGVNDDSCSNICLLAVCGDNIIQAIEGEQCDDGGIENGDGCNSLCQVEEEGGEFLADCDDGIDNDGDTQIDWQRDPECLGSALGREAGDQDQDKLP